MQVSLSIDGNKVAGYWPSFAECIRYVDSLPIKMGPVVMWYVCPDGKCKVHTFDAGDFN